MSEYSAPTQFIDLGAQQIQIRRKLDEAVQKVMDHGQYIMGPEVKEFESSLEKFTGAKHALTCANGTDAISIVLMSWDINPGDVVFVPSFTYIASAEAPAQLGAIPFFVDVNEHTFNMDPLSLKQAIIDCKKLNLNPKVVMPVDLFGQPSDIDEISKIANENGLKVLIDGAQSFGGISNDRRVGSMGDATTTSFFPAKPLGCYGDGGAIFTNNSDDASKINSIRLHGKGSHKYENIRVGMNSRLDTIQAAILIEKLKIFPEELNAREIVAFNYSKHLKNQIKIPLCKDNLKSAWAQYTIFIKNRDELQEYLKENNIPSVIYYPIPLSMQPGYDHYPSVSSGLEISSKLASGVLSLPMHPYLDESKVQKISSLIIQFTNVTKCL